MDNSPEYDELWSPRDYYLAIERLKAVIGQAIYVVEIAAGEINAGVKFSDQPLILLAVIDYPEPDPYRQLCPHMLILNDGRGVNVGRIARVSINTPFQPQGEDLLFTQQEFVQQFLFAPRSLSRESIQQTSTLILQQMFGDTPGRLLAKGSQSDEEQANSYHPPLLTQAPKA
ncbi:hypothetical protein [Thiofilum flexile]|uniref:hypothetical protein n=1 Tax=Thiofilum flexile TaxID=125627 RepID=UPI00037C10DA|nr:hypothetical protein [Thiofilum flexile]